MSSDLSAVQKDVAALIAAIDLYLDVRRETAIANYWIAQANATLPHEYPQAHRNAAQAHRDRARSDDRRRAGQVALAAIDTDGATLATALARQGEDTKQLRLCLERIRDGRLDGSALRAGKGAADLIPGWREVRAQLQEIADRLSGPRASPPTPEALPPTRRLRIEGNRIILDGKTVPLGATADGRARMLCYLRHLLDANGDWRSDPEIKKLEEERGGLTDVDRWTASANSCPSASSS